MWEITHEGVTYRATLFTPKNSGLPDDNVKMIVVDRAGNVWVDARGHLGSFDGEQWEDRTAEVLAAAKSPAAREAKRFCRRAELALRAFQRVADPSLPPDRYPWIATIGRDPEGNIWVSCVGELFKFDGDRWHEVPIPGDVCASGVTAIKPGAKGELVIASSQGGVAILRGEEWTVVRAEAPEGANFRIDYHDNHLPPGKVATDGQGATWIAPTYAKPKLQRHDGKDLSDYAVPENVNCDPSTSLDFDRHGGRLVLTSGPACWNEVGGVAAHRGEEWTSYTCGIKPQKFEPPRCPPRPPDSRAEVVLRCALAVLAHLAEPEESPPQVSFSAIHADRAGRIWLGTSQGVGLVEGNAYKLVSLVKDDEPCFAKCIAEDSHGNIWVGAYEGAYRLSPVGAAEKTEEAVTPTKAE